MKVEFCQFSGIQTKSGQIKIKPIGKAKNSIQKPTLPGWKDVVSEIVIDKKYARGLDGIEDYMLQFTTKLKKLKFLLG